MPCVGSSSIEKVFSLVETYNSIRISYAAQGDKLPEVNKDRYDALRLLRKSIIQREIGYNELKKHIEGEDILC